MMDSQALNVHRNPFPKLNTELLLLLEARGTLVKLVKVFVLFYFPGVDGGLLGFY